MLQGQQGFGESVAVFAFGKAGLFDRTNAQFILQLKPYPHDAPRGLTVNLKRKYWT